MLASIKPLFSGLKSWGQIYAPKNTEGFYVHRAVQALSEVELDFTLPVYPPKEFLLPQRELLYSFKGQRLKRFSPAEKVVVFGVRPCDANGVSILDRFMLEGIEDPYYRARREHTMIVALQCTQLYKNCLCTVFGTHTLKAGYDIGLYPSKPGFLVRGGSPKGKALLKKLKISEDKSFPEPEFKLSAKLKKFAGRISELEAYSAKGHWRTAARDCFGCAGCTMACPTCACFDIEHHSSLDLESGEVVRTWDSCQLEPFTKVAGNHVFRSSRADRFKHRYYHKLAWGDNCVGCGRCITVCPTKIDMVEVVNRL
jgi:sulfhydrogenase subunit beta (sulfur reductase)